MCWCIRRATWGTSTKHGQVVAAEEHFAATVRLRPQTAEAHCGLGVVLDSEGKAAEAMAEYSEAQRLNPGYVQAHNKIEAGIDHTQRRRRRRGEAHAAAPAPAAASVARAN